MASGCETILVIIGTFDFKCYLHEIITIRYCNIIRAAQCTLQHNMQ